MADQAPKHCARARICRIAGLSKMVLMSSGCMKTKTCKEFSRMDEKIQDKVLPLRLKCTHDGCHRDDRERVKDECLDCKSLAVSKESEDGRMVETHLRCISEYCYHGKTSMEEECLECIECRVHCDERQSWVSFRGGKDIHGKSHK